MKSSSFLREPRERRPWDGEDIGGEGEVGSEGRIINWKKPFKHIFQQSSEAYERQKQAREETSREFEEKRWARQNEIEERKLGTEERCLRLEEETKRKQLRMDTAFEKRIWDICRLS